MAEKGAAPSHHQPWRVKGALNPGPPACILLPTEFDLDSRFVVFFAPAEPGAGSRSRSTAEERNRANPRLPTDPRLRLSRNPPSLPPKNHLLGMRGERYREATRLDKSRGSFLHPGRECMLQNALEKRARLSPGPDKLDFRTLVSRHQPS